MIRSAGGSGRLSEPAAVDPVFLARAYGDPRDREAASFLAALFAYGQVDALCRAIRRILEALGPSPFRGIVERRHRDPGWLPDFRYRFNTRQDLVGVLEGAAVMIETHGSLGRGLAARRRRGEDLDAALSCWSKDLLTLAARNGSYGRGLRFLLADPALGGACKRWRLLLRWMVRPEDGIDMGLWSGLFRPSDLVVPLDTHWIRIARRLGISRRKSADGRMAMEITEFLRWIRPRDPLRYDYAVCHLGMSGGCPARLALARCLLCPLHPLCPQGGRKQVYS